MASYFHNSVQKVKKIKAELWNKKNQKRLKKGRTGMKMDFFCFTLQRQFESTLRLSLLGHEALQPWHPKKEFFPDWRFKTRFEVPEIATGQIFCSKSVLNARFETSKSLIKGNKCMIGQVPNKSLPTPEICGSNSVIDKFYLLFNCVFKYKVFLR